MEQHDGLQAADLVLGATHAFVDLALEKTRRGAFGVEQFARLADHFAGADQGKEFPYGLIPLPPDGDLAERLRAALDDL